MGTWNLTNFLTFIDIPTHENFRHASHNYRFPLLVCLSWKQSNIFSSLLKFLEEVLSNLLREIKSCFCSVLIKNIIEVIAASVFWPYSSKYFKIFDVQCKPHKDKMQWHFKEAQLSQTKQILMQEENFAAKRNCSSSFKNWTQKHFSFVLLLFYCNSDNAMDKHRIVFHIWSGNMLLTSSAN